MGLTRINRILAAFAVAIGLFFGSAFGQSAQLQAVAGPTPAANSPYKRPIRTINRLHISAKALRDEARNQDRSGTAAIEYSLWKNRHPVVETSTRLQQVADKVGTKLNLSEPSGDRSQNFLTAGQGNRR